MATQTETQRKAAANKAAATRKRNAAKQSGEATKASARRTRASADATIQTSAEATKRHARQTGRLARRTAARRVDAAAKRVDEFGRRAQRVLYIQVGAAATVRDAVVHAARTYSDVDNVVLELNKYERRGSKALSGTERELTRRRREAVSRVKSLA